MKGVSVRQRTCDVLPSVGALPHDSVGIDDGCGKPGDAGLLAKGIEIGAEDLVHEYLRVCRRAHEQQSGRQGGKAATAHLFVAIVTELWRFGERYLSGKLNSRIDIGPPGLNAVPR